MKKMLLAAAAASAVLATPAMAAVDTVASYDVTGTVQAYCSASSPGSTVVFGSDITGGGLGLTVSTGTQVEDAGAFCNGAGTKIKVAHTDLTNQDVTAAAPSGFTKTLTFKPNVVVGSGTGAATFSDDVTTATTVGAFTGLKVNATNLSSGTDKPLAGAYKGSITITLTPSV